MTYDPEKHKRRSMRLAGYDYAQPGDYFVTICTYQRACVLGEVVDGVMRPNSAGEIVIAQWHKLPEHYLHVVLDAFVVMPNHVHMVLRLVDDAAVEPDGGRVSDPPLHGVSTQTVQPTKRHTLSEVVRAFKAFSARTINERRCIDGVPVWQRGFYDHIIRDAWELAGIRHYIAINPARWTEDRDYLATLNKSST